MEVAFQSGHFVKHVCRIDFHIYIQLIFVAFTRLQFHFLVTAVLWNDYHTLDAVEQTINFLFQFRAFVFQFVDFSLHQSQLILDFFGCLFNQLVHFVFVRNIV